MVGEEDDRFSQYNSPRMGGQEIVYEQPGPMDKINEFTPAIKQNAKKIIIAIAAVIAIYLVLDFFVLSNKAFTVNVSDTEETAIPINTFNIYSGDNPNPVFSGKNSASYSVSMKPGSYRFEAKATDYKTFNKTLDAAADKPAIPIKLEKNMGLEINSLNFPTELYAGQETEGSISITNKGDNTAEAQLVFEGDLKDLGKSIFSEPETITISSNQVVTATIKISVPTSITIKDKKLGDKKSATVRIKYLNEKSEQAFSLYPSPEFEITPKSISATIIADGENKFVKDITIKNKNSFPVKNIAFAIDAEDSMKNWFSFQPEATIDSLDVKGTTQSARTIKLWANIPIGTESENISPNITITAAGTTLPPITMVIAVKPVKLDFIATASKETVNIPKEGTAYKELIGETIRLQNKGIVDIQNVDLTVDVACRDSWITFPQGSHVDTVTKATTEEVAMRITAPSSAEPNKPVTCQITVRYENPIDPTEREQQVVSLFLVPKD